MVNRNMTWGTSQTGTQSCMCGCAPCEELSCSLDCLEQPRFFCGQLLSDRDLTALLTWTQEKLRLGRFRGGWGVVCGLEVLCAGTSRTSVVVKPGYAVSECGDDIIVCEDMHAPALAALCTPPDAACRDLGHEQKPHEGAAVDTFEFAGMEVAHNQLHAFDLVLSYAELQTSPQTALGRNICGQAVPCEYSRVREVARLSWQKVDPYADPPAPDTKSWATGYQKILTDIAAINTWQVFADALAAQPPQRFCFLADLAAKQGKDAGDKPPENVLLWLLLDRLRAYLNRSCFSVKHSNGMPIARVWVHSGDTQALHPCTILLIDSMPPYRRPYGPVEWPAPAGQINLGQFIGHRYAEVARRLADYGVRVSDVNVKSVEAFVNAKDSLRTPELFAKGGDQLNALVAPSPLTGVMKQSDDQQEIVIGFVKQQASKSPRKRGN